MYSYAAENPDELSLEVGDVVSVLETKIEDVGWWKGELNGKVGVFPDNFVQRLAPTEVSRPSSSSSSSVIIHCVSEKNSQNCFCHNFVKFPPTVIIFGTKMAKTIGLCKVHSFTILPNLCRCITM